jgi:ABC-2 type transport system permease protein
MLIIGGGPLLSGLLGDAPMIRVGIVGGASPELAEALDANANVLEVDHSVSEYADRVQGEDALEAGSIAVLIDGDSIVWLDETGPLTSALVGGALGDVRRRAAIEELGLTETDMRDLFAEPESEYLREPDADAPVRQGAAYAGAVFLFMSVVLFGQFVMLGVLEEKASRVAEVVLSRVRPEELLAGKIIGIGALGLVQLIAISGSILLTMRMIDATQIPNLSAIGLDVASRVVGWYILGYAFYSVWYAAAGSLVPRQEDVQAVGWIPMVGLLPAYVLALVASWAPESLVVRIASIFPATAPLVMPVRESASDVPAWEVLLAVGVTMLSAYVLVRLAARIYRGGILRSGRLRMREAWRATT